MKILLAEDDPNIQMVAKLTLQRVGGHEVFTVNNGQEALDMIGNGSEFELIILDGNMPIKDGFQTCQILKSNPDTAKLPIIFLTAKNQQNDLDEAMRLGAIGYIVKPFDAKELCNEIQKIMNKQIWKSAS